MENNTSISDIKFMSDGERKDILSINNTVSPYESTKSIIQLFKEVVKLHPNDVAVIFENEKMTYEKLDKKSSIVADFLIKNGVKPYDRVALCIDKSFNLIIGILGILKCQACYVPLDSNYSNDRKEYIIHESNCNLCLCDKTFDLTLEK